LIASGRLEQSGFRRPVLLDSAVVIQMFGREVREDADIEVCSVDAISVESM